MLPCRNSRPAKRYGHRASLTYVTLGSAGARTVGRSTNLATSRGTAAPPGRVNCMQIPTACKYPVTRNRSPPNDRPLQTHSHRLSVQPIRPQSVSTRGNSRPHGAPTFPALRPSHLRRAMQRAQRASVTGRASHASDTSRPRTLLTLSRAESGPPPADASSPGALPVREVGRRCRCMQAVFAAVPRSGPDAARERTPPLFGR